MGVVLTTLMWSDIKHRRLKKPVANHFNSEGHSLEDLSIFVIEQIHREEASFRKAKESYWIQTLRSLAHEGPNLDPYIDQQIWIMMALLTQFSIKTLVTTPAPMQLFLTSLPS